MYRPVIPRSLTIARSFHATSYGMKDAGTFAPFALRRRYSEYPAAISCRDTFSIARYISPRASVCDRSRDISTAELPKLGAHNDKGPEIKDVVGSRAL